MTDRPDFGVLASEDGTELAALVETLQDQICRDVVSSLLDRETADLDELVDVVTARKTVDSGRIVSADERDRLRIELYHVHLPRLAELDVVEFDPEERTVRLSGAAEQLRTLLEWIEHGDASPSGNGLQ